MVPRLYSFLISGLLLMAACGPARDGSESKPYNPDYSERFADLRVIQYDVPGFDLLTLQQKKLLYYLSQATRAGRDIYYDQNYRYNLRVRKTLEAILEHYDGNRGDGRWADFLVYAKRFFYSNGIHHHYAEEKITPGCPPEYFAELVLAVPEDVLPLSDGQTAQGLIDWITPIVYDPGLDGQRVVKTAGVDLVRSSAVNYYRGVTQAEAEAFYAEMRAGDADPNRPLSHGLNGLLVKLDGPVSRAWRVPGALPATLPGAGDIVELPWCIGGETHPTGLPGLYSEALEEVVYWLQKASDVAENERQQQAIELLIEYYRTGELDTWDAYNVAWLRDTEGAIDYIHGFIEVYKDPLGLKGYYEGIIQMTDPEASRRIQKLSAEAQWFEDNSPLIPEHKKPDVRGISARVITVVQEGGAAAPNTPIGVNLPNANWIRAEHGSKSVSLDNIVNAINQSTGSGSLEEFAWDEEERRLGLEYGILAGKLHTDLHEVIGHASGVINPGVLTPSETLKNYANTLEEARADAFALYFALDPKLVELGLSPSLDVGKAQYAAYIRNGLMLQLRRVALERNLEQDHMRNRQLVASWAFALGRDRNIIERQQRDGKTFFVVTDFEALREIFGQQLREIQRIKSEGDFEAGQALVETYGVKIDPALHAEVIERYVRLDMAPYTGFIQPELILVEENGEIVDVQISYPDDFVGQMLDFGRRYAFLPAR